MQSAVIIRTQLVHIFRVLEGQLMLYVFEDGYIYKSEPITLDSNIDQKDLDKYIFIYAMDDDFIPNKIVNGEEITYASTLPVEMFIKSEQPYVMRRICETGTTATNIDDAIKCSYLVKKELTDLKRNIDKATDDLHRIQNAISAGSVPAIDQIKRTMVLNMELPTWIDSYNTGIDHLVNINALVDRYIQDGVKSNIIHKCEVCKKYNNTATCIYCK